MMVKFLEMYSFYMYWWNVLYWGGVIEIMFVLSILLGNGNFWKIGIRREWCLIVFRCWDI